MKASDTVINFMRIEEIDAKNATSNFTDTLVDVAREQAEISFKAGINEVVEYIKFGKMAHNRADIYRGEANGQMQFLIPRKDWQSKLKEWGL